MAYIEGALRRAGSKILLGFERFIIVVFMSELFFWSVTAHAGVSLLAVLLLL